MQGDDFNAYLKGLYNIYVTEIANANFTFHQKPLHVFTTLNYNLQHLTFEHITTKGSNDRLYNQNRCERIIWIKDILNKICDGCADYRVFRDRSWKQDKKVARYILWCVKEDYVIVLEERATVVMLITAYCIVYSNKRRELNDKYLKFSQK